MCRKCCLGLCFVLFGTLFSQAYVSYTNLADAYAAIGFDPSAGSNAVVVLFSDPHIDLDSHGDSTPFTYGLDSRLVDTVNAMSPPPAKIVVAGDVVSSYSEVPGYIPQSDFYLRAGTNEMLLWLSAVQSFTNVNQTNIVWTPGNHDQDPRETNAELFCALTASPPHQAFDLAGVHFMLMNGGNYGHPSQDERQWLLKQVASTSPTQTIAVVVHQPPFGAVSSERGIALLLREALGDWPNPWWVYAGHAHSQILGNVQVGNSQAALRVTSTTNPKPYYGGRSLGYRILCLSNGIASNIYYHFDNADFQIEPGPDRTARIQYQAAFENASGLLWRRLKTAGTPPEVLVAFAYDLIEWYAYPIELQWALPLDRYGNQATHFLLLSTGFSASRLSFSTDRTNWIIVPTPPSTNQLLSFAMPPEVAAAPIGYVRYLGIGRPDIAIGGWGLATTNGVTFQAYPQLTPIPDQQVVVGDTLWVTNTFTDPYSPPDHITFSLVSGPSGAAVDAESGIFSWEPLIDQPALVPVTLKVSDNGTPEMSDTKQFWITVRPGPELIPTLLDGRFALGVFGDTNLNYTILASTNLFDWLPIYQTNLPAMPFHFEDPDFPNFPQRFFRLLAQPAVTNL